MNETLQAIAGRWSCRAFTSESPTDEQLRAIAAAGAQAPSGMNRQAWRIVVVKNHSLMEEMEQEALAQMQKLNTEIYERILSRGGKVFYGAPSMIVIPIEAAEEGAKMDCGILCQNMVLAATSLGLNTLICGLAALAFTGEKGDLFARRLEFPHGYGFGIALLLGHAAAPGTPHEPDMSKISYIE